MATLTLPEFVAPWQGSRLTERSAAQSHFIDLCEALGQSRPAAVDQEGTVYTFEKGATKSGGGQGWADVWFKGHFGWEYKGPRKDLKAAYQQLQQYREDLENPPLLVVCDLERFEVHTNFTGTVKRVYSFTLADLLEPEPIPTTHGVTPLEVLRSLWIEPGRLRPEVTAAGVTEQAAGEFARLAESLRGRGAEPERAAHFLMRLLFCLFAEDTGLLPRRLFTRLVEQTRARPEEFGARLRFLFAAMATGGSFGVEDIAHFNGGLFADDTVLGLTSGDMGVLARAGQLDWTSVEPAIFGTLFERSLDPQKRGQLGAHYTSKEDILMIVEPVLMAPLRRRWEDVQERAQALIVRRDGAGGGARTRHQQTLSRLLMGFAGEIAAVRVLDPACGSGNFLYVALKRLLDLEKEVIAFAATNGLTAFFPQVEPDQLYGIELNTYAHELAQVVVWIGYIQWLNDNGFGIPDHPILKPLNNILHMDAVLAHDDAGLPMEPEWPEAEVIIGNPPFLGDKKMRTELGDKYVDDLRSLYSNRIPGQSDFVCYWFERSRQLIADGKVRRAGLLATNSIRTGANRRTLDRIKATGDIFMAWDDRPWVVEGADVRVSIVGFDNGTESQRTLDELPVADINPDLTAAVNVTVALRLKENEDLSFIGAAMHGPFDVTGKDAQAMIAAPVNPNGRPNGDVIRPWLNGLDLTRRPRNSWVIDFGVDLTVDQAALYELPFEYVRKVVKPIRDQNRRLSRRTHWWRLGEPMPRMRSRLSMLACFIATPRVAKHRVFARFPTVALPSDQLVVFAREDDYFLGVLQSKVHELWAVRMCSWLGVGNDPRYTPSTIVETFPFPRPPGHEPVGDMRVEAIAAAARKLVEHRDRWLNPEEADEAELKRRTLTNLYNQRPAWLEMAHRRLDEAVLDAYGWPHDLSDEEILERLLALNLERAAARGD